MEAILGPGDPIYEGRLPHVVLATSKPIGSNRALRQYLNGEIGTHDYPGKEMHNMQMLRLAERLGLEPKVYLNFDPDSNDWPEEWPED